LLGVPITIKESFNITGLPTTYGIPRFKDFVPTEDAVLVSRVKSAGAVILGKTNVPLLLGDVVAGPDEEREGVGYRLALRPARHDELKSFRVLVIDTHPLMPTSAAVRTALDHFSTEGQQLGRRGNTRRNHQPS
jgi:Asp-tRNA(Asn)/Glu-tRNA(Gln) amidotransferase A subunit family amidase